MTAAIVAVWMARAKLEQVRRRRKQVPAPTPFQYSVVFWPWSGRQCVVL